MALTTEEIKAQIERLSVVPPGESSFYREHREEQLRWSKYLLETRECSACEKARTATVNPYPYCANHN